MNKLLAALSIPLLSSSLFKCQLLDTKKIDYSGDYNPGHILHGYSLSDDQIISIDNYECRFNYNEREETQTIINDYIPGETFFTNISEENMDTSADSFDYYVNRRLLFGTSTYNLTFYKNGYAKVKTKDKDLPAYYYYKFDVTTANRLYNKVFNIVDAHRQQAIDMDIEKNRFNEMISTFYIDEVLNDVRAMETLSFYYYSYTLTDYISSTDLKDDGTIKDLILNATYEQMSSSVREDANYRKTVSFSRYLRDEQGKEIWSYSFSLSENSYLVTISKSMCDKYERSYYKTLIYSVGRETTHSIFDKAIELYEIAKQKSKQVEDRLDNFSMTNVVDIINSTNPFTFEYQPQTFRDGEGRTILTDDGSIKELLNGGNYVFCNDYARTPGVSYENIILYYQETKEEEPEHIIFLYYCYIYTDGIIKMSLFAEDENERFHYHDKAFSLDEGTTQSLFNKAREMYSAR